jgi:predicted dienelactone hydrolase
MVVSRPRRVLRRSLLASALALALPMGPAHALEEVVVELPLIDSTMTVRLNELQSPEALLQGNTQLAELDRATDGRVGKALVALFNHRLPLAFSKAATTSVGSPLLEQGLLLVSSFGTVEGRPADLSGETLEQTLRRAMASAPDGQPTLLQVMRAIPGKRARLNLSQAGVVLQRMLLQRQLADRLLARLTPAPAAVPATATPGARAVQSSTALLPVAHRPQPLKLLVLQPQGQGNGRLVLISHGLWDSPSSFEGWGQRLAAAGYTVVLPWHPGSDKNQQSEVLNGQAPPPTPQELALRPLDLTAVIDAIGSGALPTNGSVNTQRVVVLGHSWGATTSLLMAGLVPTDSALLSRCGTVNHPERNLSWTLQCSWASAVKQAAINDERIIAVVAVSPPMSLLFPRESGHRLNTRVLLVSGSRDWVVPPDPEAIRPLQDVDLQGHQLVLVKGGDHFNLRPQDDPQGGVLGPLMLAWTEAAFAAGAKVHPGPGVAVLLPPGPWGSPAMPMVDASAAVGSAR